MKKNPFPFLFSLFVIFFFQALSATTYSQHKNYTGTYVMRSGEVTLTLKLRQQGTRVTGTLASTNGATFQVSGTVEEGGVATGTCRNQQGGVYFEAYLDKELSFSLIEPGTDGQPDYDKARYLVFDKTGSGGAPGAVMAAGNQEAGRPVNIYQQQSQPNQQYSQQQSAQPQQAPHRQNAGMGQMAAAPPSGNEIGDASWGFRFRAPAGWTHQQNAQVAILGHNTIPGIILVMPHYANSVQEMQQQMMQGLQDETITLRPSGNLTNAGNNTLALDYTGMVQGQQARAKGYGVLSPNGGGAYVLAVATPDKYSAGLEQAALSITRNMRYVQGGSSDMIKYFAGVWITTTTSTSNTVYLYADGTYSDHYEAAYSGNYSNGYQNTGAWGAAGAQNGRGRWRVQGNRDQGQMIFIDPDGSQEVMEYYVHTENGQKYYNEYVINGTLWHRKNKYDE